MTRTIQAPATEASKPKPAARYRGFSHLALALLVLASAQPSIAQTHVDAAAVWRASSRLGYGPTAASAQAASANPKAWAMHQIGEAYAASQQPPRIPADVSAFNAPIADIIAGYQLQQVMVRDARKQAVEKNSALAAGSTEVVLKAANLQEFSREMAQTASAWRLMSCSDPALEQPLLARMTEFWFNHFNVSVQKASVRPFVGHYVVNAIRANALGKFEDLVLATAHHPAMLFYLDQAQSNARGLNENYARELMELHTLGVNSGYSQNDVRELARILTGWSVDLPRAESFTFRDRLHDQGDKTLLGRTFRADGANEGVQAIRMLAREPATASRIARRLAETFVADQPPQTLVDRLASSFTNTQGDIRAVMQTLVSSPDFWQTDNALFKTPMDFACSALTAAGGAKEKRDIQLTQGFLAQAGQPIHGWQTPDGYKTSAATWLAPEALTRRADYALSLGARIEEPVYLQPFISPANRERIAREPAGTRAGLMLASPDFMSK